MQVQGGYVVLHPRESLSLAVTPTKRIKPRAKSGGALKWPGNEGILSGPGALGRGGHPVVKKKGSRTHNF